VDAMPDLSPMAASAAVTHEMYEMYRVAGFSRAEALYIVTRPSVEIVRLEWFAARPGGGTL
jgi:hypothetical protein